MNSILTRTVLLTAGFVGTAAPAFGAVQAQTDTLDQAATPSEVVRYGDLDLATAGGADLLYSRLNRAARNVCDEDSLEPVSAALWWLTKSCEQSAIAHAVAQVNSAKLTAVYDRHYPGSAAARTVRSSAPARAKEITVG